MRDHVTISGRSRHRDAADTFGHLDVGEKREYLRVLSDVVWDIESELAQAKAERAALMTSLQSDLRLAGQ